METPTQLHDQDFTWQNDANCAGMDTNLFFYERNAQKQREKARAVCAGCLVRTECLEFAIANNIVDGMWGGKSGRERRQIKHARLRVRKKVAV
ncbi:WhiB family transcriptional regulator [bacterium]|nr:WhiB family transcriptional regulator [bacterium]